MKLHLYIISLVLSIQVQSQNLIVNPGAESRIDSGWTTVLGNWFQMNASNGGIYPHTGMYHFGAPNSCPLEAAAGKSSEIFQDIDVASYAHSIDSGSAQYTLSGWVATYMNQDNSRVILEYRDSSNNILYTFDSGYLKKTNWFKISSTQIAPLNTRTIRIRLVSKCGATASDDDGYYDDLSLTYTNVSTVTSINDIEFINTSTEEIIVKGNTSEILRIFDINGNLIQYVTKDFNEDDFKILKNNLPKGLLFIVLESSNSIRHKKMINY